MENNKHVSRKKETQSAKENESSSPFETACSRRSDSIRELQEPPFSAPEFNVGQSILDTDSLLNAEDISAIHVQYI